MHWSCYTLCQDRSFRTWYIVKAGGRVLQSCSMTKIPNKKNKKKFKIWMNMLIIFLHLLVRLLKFLATIFPTFIFSNFQLGKRNRDCSFVEQLQKLHFWPSLKLSFKIFNVFQIEYPTHFLNIRIDQRKNNLLYISVYN